MTHSRHGPGSVLRLRGRLPGGELGRPPVQRLPPQVPLPPLGAGSRRSRRGGVQDNDEHLQLLCAHSNRVSSDPLHAPGKLSPAKGERLHLGTRSGSYKRLRGKGALKKVDNGDSACVQLYSAAGEGFGMPDVHFHIWIYQRDSDGVIRSMERRAEQFDTRRKANYALEMFRRQRSLAGQVLQCVDGTFCKPPPDWVVRGYTIAGPREVTAEYFIDDTPSIRPSRKLAQGMKKLEQYARNHPDDVLRRPSDDSTPQ